MPPTSSLRKPPAAPEAGTALRLAVVCDYAEERWPSMDLVGAMIYEHVAAGYAGPVAPTIVRPDYRRRFERVGASGAARNADRLLNRFLDYPGILRRLARRGEFDVYHIVDHSYAQLVHALPAERTVVTCHDLDTFRCLLRPELEPRPAWFRAMTRRILDGMAKAAAVVCVTEATREAVIAHGLVPPDRLHVVPNGVQPECSPDPDPEVDAEADRLIGPRSPGGAPCLLHVGSNIPRKRFDVALELLARVRRARPEVRLLKVGGALKGELAELAERLGVADAVVALPFIDAATLAAVYRRAALTIFPSEAEGFGLPVAEALACGTPILVSDLPVLREVGSAAVEYAPVGDAAAWADKVLELLDERERRPEAWEARRRRGLEWAARYRWTAHAAQLGEIYRNLPAAK